MGTRYYLTLKCPKCGYVDYEDAIIRDEVGCVCRRVRMGDGGNDSKGVAVYDKQRRTKKMMNNRKELLRCQYPVLDHTTLDGEMDCGEPAIVVWSWGDDKMYVCEEHDEIVDAQEGCDEKNDKKVRPSASVDAAIKSMK